MARKGHWYVVETRWETVGHTSLSNYSRPLPYRQAVALLGDMARLKHESQMWSVNLTPNQYDEICRMADAGVPVDYTGYGGLH